MKKADYSFFQNLDCEYFPCHKSSDVQSFNCLYCFCPLYALGDGCGGGFVYTDEGVKDCSGCHVPHSPGGHEFILEKLPQIAELAKKKD